MKILAFPDDGLEQVGAALSSCVPVAWVLVLLLLVMAALNGAFLIYYFRQR